MSHLFSHRYLLLLTKKSSIYINYMHICTHLFDQPRKQLVGCIIKALNELAHLRRKVCNLLESGQGIGVPIRNSVLAAQGDQDLKDIPFFIGCDMTGTRCENKIQIKEGADCQRKPAPKAQVRSQDSGFA